MPPKLPPGPRRSLWSEASRLRRMGPQAFIAYLVQRYGDIVLVQIGRFNAYLVSDPGAIRDILTVHHRETVKGRETKRLIPYLGNGLLTSDGETHKRQRSMLQPAFHRSVISSYADVMAGYAEQFISAWHDGAVVDMSSAMGQLSMAIVMKTLLDVDLDAEEAASLGRDLRTTLDIYGAYLGLPFDLLMNLPLPTTQRYYAALRRLDTALFRRIVARRAATGDHGDLLQLLLDAHDGEVEGVGLDVSEVRDQVMTFYFAGHETLSSVLPWVLYLLASAPSIAQRVEIEVDQVLGGRLPKADDIPKLTYTTQVLQEALRLYPPIISLSRRVITPFEIMGYSIPVDAHVYMSQYAVQRDPRWWPDPERFDPDRFSPGANMEWRRAAYFPFGMGARQCIGEGFAMLEGVIILAILVQRWRLQPISSSPPPFTKNIITLRPRGGMPLRLNQR